MHAQMNADPARPQTATGRSAAAAVYRERLSPSLWTLLSAAVAAPMVSLVFVPLDSTVALLAGLAVGAALVGSLVLAAPVIEVRGGELRVGRAHIPVRMLGEASGAVGDEAREVRGPGLPRTAWHLLRPGIDGIVRVRVIDQRDPVDEWIFSTRTPDRVIAAIRRAQRAGARRAPPRGLSGRAHDADGAEGGLVVDLGAVLDEEALDAGELVVLRGQHDDVELEVGEVGTGQFEPGRVVGVFVADRTGELVGHALLQGLDRLAVVVGLAGGVVIGRHALTSRI